MSTRWKRSGMNRKVACMAHGCRCTGGRLLPVAVALCLAAHLMAASSGMTLAQTAAAPSEPCFDEAETAAPRIAACTRLIEGTKDAAKLAQAYLQRGVLREQGGESETAVTDYSEAIKLDPTNALAHFNRGNAHDQLGKFDLAIADYSQAIKLDPKEPDYFNNRGQAYDHKGQHERAIADYTEAARLDPDN